MIRRIFLQKNRFGEDLAGFLRTITGQIPFISTIPYRNGTLKTCQVLIIFAYFDIVPPTIPAGIEGDHVLTAVRVLVATAAFGVDDFIIEDR